MNNAIILFPAKLFNLIYSSVLLRFKSIKQRSIFVTILQSNRNLHTIDFLQLTYINYFFSKKLKFFPKKFGNPNFVRIFVM